MKYTITNQNTDLIAYVAVIKKKHGVIYGRVNLFNKKNGMPYKLRKKYTWTKKKQWNEFTHQ